MSVIFHANIVNSHTFAPKFYSKHTFNAKIPAPYRIIVYAAGLPIAYHVPIDYSFYFDSSMAPTMSVSVDPNSFNMYSFADFGAKTYTKGSLDAWSAISIEPYFSTRGKTASDISLNFDADFTGLMERLAARTHDTEIEFESNIGLINAVSVLSNIAMEHQTNTIGTKVRVLESFSPFDEQLSIMTSSRYKTKASIIAPLPVVDIRFDALERLKADMDEINIGEIDSYMSCVCGYNESVDLAVGEFESAAGSKTRTILRNEFSISEISMDIGSGTTENLSVTYDIEADSSLRAKSIVSCGMDSSCGAVDDIFYGYLTRRNLLLDIDDYTFAEIDDATLGDIERSVIY